MDSLDGVLTRVMFHKSSKWNPAGTPYLIAKLSNGTTVKGEMSEPKTGENYRFWGCLQDQKGGYEQAFEFSTYEILIDESEAGVALYLRRYVPGLGHTLSSLLVDHFGVETLSVLRSTPERAAEASPKITPALVAAIKDHFESATEVDPVTFAKLTDLFSDMKPPRRIITQLCKDFGSNAIPTITRKPYSTLLKYPGLAWKRVDDFATNPAKLAYPLDGVDRHAACIVECLEQISGEGHTYAERAEIDSIAFKLLSGLPISEAWVYCLANQLISADTLDQREREFEERAAIYAEADDVTNTGLDFGFVRDNLDSVYFRPGVKFALPKIARAEEEIARRLVTIATQARALPVLIDASGLNPDQANAANLIARDGVALLVGGPGTGKSFTIARVLSGLVESGIEGIRVAAPTGKAAKRAAELLAAAGLPSNKIPCSTIHKALAPVPSEKPEDVPSSSAKIGRGREAFGFSRNEENPIEEQIVVIDETSMVDVQLGASLLRAIAPGTRLVFVGDANQLPSVGPGSMLRDMMEAGLPTASLTKIQRSESAGRVVHACHAIKDGLLPVPADRVSMPCDNWRHIEAETQAEIAEIIVSLHEVANPAPPWMWANPDLLWDWQVVTPQNAKHACACNNLNKLLSHKLNPPPAAEGDYRETQPGDKGDFEPMFRVRDKIVRTKNGIADQMIPVGKHTADDGVYEDWRWKGEGYAFDPCEIVNGDMGAVEDIVIEGKKSWVVVRFRTPDRLCRLPMTDHHLSLAYALTCHKAQGSGFPFVIVPVHPAWYWDEKTQTGIFSREWLYTAISRAERLLVTVGQSSAIRAAIGRKTIHRRRTRLVDLIRREMSNRGDKPVVVEGKAGEALSLGGGNINQVANVMEGIAT